MCLKPLSQVCPRVPAEALTQSLCHSTVLFEGVKEGQNFCVPFHNGRGGTAKPYRETTNTNALVQWVLMSCKTNTNDKRGNICVTEPRNSPSTDQFNWLAATNECRRFIVEAIAVATAYCCTPVPAVLRALKMAPPYYLNAFSVRRNIFRRRHPPFVETSGPEVQYPYSFRISFIHT